MCASALNRYVDVSTLNISIFEVYPLNTFLLLHTHAQKREPVQNSAKGGHLHTGPWPSPDRTACQTFIWSFLPPEQ